MTQQSSITPFLTAPSPNTPPYEDSIQPVKKKQKISRKKTSWIWEYFIEGFNDKDELIIICQVEGEEGKKCNVKLKHDGSTGNGISHLWSVHKITKDGKQPADKQQKLDVIKKHPEKRQNTLRQFLVNWIIDDLQPFSVVNSPSFRIFCNELDPAFLVPEAKTIKAIIHQAYNFTYPKMVEQIGKEAISVALTADLWTGRNRKGFLGITCSYIDPEFILKEVILAIEYVQYPHTAEHIAECFEDFFMTPKQSERLEKIQKDHPSLANNEEGEEPVVCIIDLIIFFINNKEKIWNSSYLAWNRLIKLKGYIKGLLNHLELESDPDSQKDAKRLRNIMITEDEWSLILDLTEVLSHFADATDYLGGSKYCTYSSMNPTIIEIMKWIRPSSSNNNFTDINLDRTVDAFGEVSELEKNREINTPINSDVK
ncbi:unnamed protein product [Rhizophagus irregularis]|uniref:Uncharacterized protein n=1 Tax=Rhizophagus irregularis TaxID=588596 RepID=A0A915ZB05_9GLOM|nr:unnamed protein product [Rhizophagus irregularis]